MPTSNRRIPPKSSDDWLYRRIEELERKVDQIENRAYPTVPVYDYNSLPNDPIEGQIAIIANAPDITVGGLGLAGHDWGYYELDTVAGASTGSGTGYFGISLAFASGAAGVDLLDLTSGGPSYFLPNESGTYFFLARVVVGVVGGTFPANSWAQIQMGVDTGDPPPANDWGSFDTFSLKLDGNPATVCTVHGERYFDRQAWLDSSSYMSLSGQRIVASDLTISGEMFVQRK